MELTCVNVWIQIILSIIPSSKAYYMQNDVESDIIITAQPQASAATFDPWGSPAKVAAPAKVTVDPWDSQPVGVGGGSLLTAGNVSTNNNSNVWGGQAAAPAGGARLEDDFDLLSSRQPATSPMVHQGQGQNAKSPSLPVDDLLSQLDSGSGM
jgi:hypothetical protein